MLTSPRVVTFTFPDTPNAQALEQFGATLTQTPWFSEVTRGFCIDDGGTCIQPGRPGLSVEIGSPAAAVYVDTSGNGTATAGVDLQSFVRSTVASAVAANTIPAPDGESVYVFYFPPSATIDMGDPSAGGYSICGGYHYFTTYTDGSPLVYAVVADCDYYHATPDYLLSQQTFDASHEIIEATTDPYVGGWTFTPMTDAGVKGLPTNAYRNDPFGETQLSEVADPCEYLPGVPLDSGLSVTRVWSPGAAARNEEPCVPVPPGDSTFNATSDKAIYVADVGVPFVVNLQAFASAPRPSWLVWAADATNSANGPYLRLDYLDAPPDGGTSLDCVNNGETVRLQVTLLADPSQDPSLVSAWPAAQAVLVGYDKANEYGEPLLDGGSVPLYPGTFWGFEVITPATAAKLGLSDAGVSYLPAP